MKKVQVKVMLVKPGFRPKVENTITAEVPGYTTDTPGLFVHRGAYFEGDQVEQWTGGPGCWSVSHKSGRIAPLGSNWDTRRDALKYAKGIGEIFDWDRSNEEIAQDGEERGREVWKELKRIREDIAQG